MGDEELDQCLKGCDVVAIPAGVPRKPGTYIYTPFIAHALLSTCVASELQYLCSRN